MVKNLSNLGIEGTLLRVIKANCDQPIVNVIDEEKLEGFPPSPRTRQGHGFSMWS